MEILSFFTPNEPIAGLEISEEALRLVLLETVKVRVAPGVEIQKNDPTKPLEKKSSKIKLKKYQHDTKLVYAVEEPLGEGIVENGILKNPQAFSGALSRLIKKTKTTVRYVVLTFTNPKVYTKLYTFPNILGDDKIRDTMRLTVDHQLPLNPDEFYTDWKRHNRTENKEVLVASAPRSLIEGFSKVLLSSGVHIVAAELSPISVARLFPEVVTEKPVLLIIENRDNFTETVLKNSLIRFSRTIPYEFCDRSQIPEEARKIADFYDAENKEKIDQIFLIGGSGVLAAPVKKSKLTKIKTSGPWSLPVVGAETIAQIPIGLTNPGVFLPALGAAKRGVIPRSEDSHISLMAVSTETAYETQKALIFTEFLSHLVIGLSLLMVVIFIGFWSLSVSLQKTKGDQLSAASAIPVPQGSAELESKVTALNDILGVEGAVAGTIPRWSIVVQQLKTLTGPGIKISSFSFPSSNGIFSVTGVAADHLTLRKFKASLEKDQFFSEVNLPVENINMKNDIPFSMSFRLDDVQAIYYH